MAAPDIDLDVLVQRAVTVRLGLVPERMSVYISSKDKALSLSNWLFGGTTRFGSIRSDMFSKDELEMLREAKSVQIIDSRVSNTGSFGHDYFHSNPAVSSDLILLMRYRRAPGAENHGIETSSRCASSARLGAP